MNDTSSLKEILTSLFDVSKTLKEPKRFISILVFVLLIGFIVLITQPFFCKLKSEASKVL